VRTLVLLLILGLCLGQPGTAVAQSRPATVELDHILLWGRDIDQVSVVMAVKLGLQVRPGRNPGGVANRYVRMADGSYLELLGITRPDAAMDAGMQADQARLHRGAGSRTFGLRSTPLDATRLRLQQSGLRPTAIFSASLDDPDGDGPSAPPRWRLFAFDSQPLSSNLFFIDYAVLRHNVERAEDGRAARQHPDTARELSAVWLLSSDADADRRQLERMGFSGAAPVRMAQIAARGFAVPVGHKQVVVLQPDGAGMAAEALRRGGSQVFGVSIGVADLDRAKRQVERGYEKALVGYHGLLGNSFLAPTQGDLGLLVEFHAMPR
jgi:hypothetical protein